MTKPEESKTQIKLNVGLTASQRASLERAADASSMSVSELARQRLQLGEWVQEQLAAGHDILVDRHDGHPPVIMAFIGLGFVIGSVSSPSPSVSENPSSDSPEGE